MSVLNVNYKNWKKKILLSETLTLVNFWHEGCPWCIRLEPIYIEVASEFKNKVKFTKINILSSQENQQIAIEYGVMSTPTLIFFCDGRPVETTMGFQSKERLKLLVDDVVNKHKECLEKSTEIKKSN